MLHLIEVDYGFFKVTEKVRLGLNDKTPTENAKSLFPKAKSIKILGAVKQKKSKRLFGIGTPQSERDY